MIRVAVVLIILAPKAMGIDIRKSSDFLKNEAFTIYTYKIAKADNEINDFKPLHGSPTTILVLGI